MAENSVAQGRFCWYTVPGALNDIANFHIRRQATSQRLQLMQYLSASS